MAHVYKNKNIHTKPENAGAQNLVGKNLPKDEDGIMKKIHPVWIRSQDKTKIYAGHWTEQDLTNAVAEFFTYCNDVDLKPTKPGLQLWLGISRSMYCDWINYPDKYGYKSNILKLAEQTMEFYLQSNIDKYPTGSIFLLKTSHGHVEQNRLDITSNGMAMTPKADEIEQSIKMLGLDEKHD